MTQDAELLGTPAFMAPEQAGGQSADVDARSDIFSLGAITYRALSGQLPFSSTSLPVLLGQIRNEDAPALTTLRPDIPAGVEQVINVAMAKPRGERYQRATEFASDLRAAFAGRALSVGGAMDETAELPRKASDSPR